MDTLYTKMQLQFLKRSQWLPCFSPAGLALASGLAATVTITHMLKAGDGIVCMDDVYGGMTPFVTWKKKKKYCNNFIH